MGSPQPGNRQGLRNHAGAEMVTTSLDAASALVRLFLQIQLSAADCTAVVSEALVSLELPAYTHRPGRQALVFRRKMSRERFAVPPALPCLVQTFLLGTHTQSFEGQLGGSFRPECSHPCVQGRRGRAGWRVLGGFSGSPSPIDAKPPHVQPRLGAREDLGVWMELAFTLSPISLTFPSPLSGHVAL